MIAPLPDQSSRAHDAADYLSRLIEDLRPGDRVGTKEELRQRLPVAMGTMNEAVRLLQERGLVTMKSGPKGGLFVASPNPLVNLGQLIAAIRGEPSAVREVQSIRNSLEPLIVLAALRDRDRADVSQLRKLIKEMAVNVDDPPAFLTTSWKLHTQIAQCGKERLLTGIYLLVSDVLSDQLKDLKQSPQTSRERLQVHFDLVNSIVDQDEEAARDAIARHAQEPT
jgi:DNA-binding FadR family transcriptional regulator